MHHRLTEEEKQTIKRLYETQLFSQEILAKCYEVSQCTISRIVSGKQDIAIRRLYKTGLITQQKLAECCDVSVSTLQKILKR